MEGFWVGPGVGPGGTQVEGEVKKWGGTLENFPNPYRIRRTLFSDI